MTELLNTPIFGFVLTIVAYLIGVHISKRVKNPLFNPVVLSMTIIIIILATFHIDYKIYEKGGDIFTFFIGPATVVLALPLYKQLDKLKNNVIPIMAGITAGTAASVLSVIYLSKLFGIDRIIILSLIPKASTTAISKEVSAMIGGIPALAIAATSITGISGYMMGPGILKLLKIDDKVATGIAMGTISHAMGTAKAMEMGETQGAMASLAIGIAGLLTVLLSPWVAKVLL